MNNLEFFASITCSIIGFCISVLICVFGGGNLVATSGVFTDEILCSESLERVKLRIFWGRAGREWRWYS